MRVDTDNYTSHVSIKSPTELFVHRVHSIQKQGEIIDVHGDYWTMGVSHFSENNLKLRCGEKWMPLIGPLAIYIPPFSILEWQVEPIDIEWFYLISKNKLSESLPNWPLLFYGVDVDLTLNLLRGPSEELISWIHQKLPDLSSPSMTHAQRIANRLKTSIDLSYREEIRIQDLCHDLNVSISFASRCFSDTFHISPVGYRTQLRIIQSGVDLLMGAPSVQNAQFNVGIEDSSYFYEKFKKLMKSTPGRFRIQSPNPSSE